MSISAPFIHRPAGTTLLTIAIALGGVLGYLFLPVSPLPEVEFPTIQVAASLPGASPETMASAVATPLERQFGRIAGVTEMTSTSFLGTSTIVIQFDLNRSIDAAARDVQAAINAARGQLPPNLPQNPTYRKENPADSPIVMFALTSDLVPVDKIFEAASSILAQKISQVQGVGQVDVGGGALPAVRVDVNPTILNNYGLSLEDVRAALGKANANRPKGKLSNDRYHWTLNTTDQLFSAKDYKPLIIAYKDGGAVRLSDVANVTDSVEDIRTGGLYNGDRAVLLMVRRQPGANIMETVARVLKLQPELKASMSPAIKLNIVFDRTVNIRASVRDVEITLLISITLVILVVFVFLKDLRTTLIPSVAVPVSLLGTFGVMYLANYSLDNLSLMALTISTGFVVDDAIVVIENITRHLEAGMRPMQAALLGASEIGFTVVSISVSLVAVFIPILLMGGIVGRLFREFAVTLSVAIAVSLVISLTTTPMMCAKLLRTESHQQHGRLYRASDTAFHWIVGGYGKTLSWVLRNQLLILLITLSTLGLTVYLYVAIPKGFFPQQDTGHLVGQIIADQDTSFQAMRHLLVRMAKAVASDPAVVNVDAYNGGSGGGGGTANQGRMFVILKPFDERKITTDEVIARLRGKLSKIPGATLYLQSTQDLRIGGHSSAAQYQYTLEGDNLADLNQWAPRMYRKLRSLPGLVDVNSDQQIRGLQASLAIDRNTAQRMGISPQMIDDTLYDAFGQRQVSTIYTQLNQYHVVLEVAPPFWQNPDGLKYIYVRSNNGELSPLSAFTHYQPSTTALAVNHQGQFPAITISFNLIPNFSLGDAVTEIEDAENELHIPPTVHGSFRGTAQAFQDSLTSEPVLIAAALITVYIVLGILYESYIHPITILSTLPSAGVGALLALILTRTELSVIALIGIILLIGIVKKKRDSNDRLRH